MFLKINTEWSPNMSKSSKTLQDYLFIDEFEFQEIINSLKTKEIIEKYNITARKINIFFKQYNIKKICKNSKCNNLLNYKNTYCSKSCQISYRNSDPKFIEKCKQGNITYYNNRTQDEKDQRNKNIQDSLNNTISFLSKEQRKDKFSNKVHKQKAYNNQLKYCKQNNITVLFTFEDYNVHKANLEYSCNKCNNIIKITKSTGTPVANCDKCNPAVVQKSKEQRKVYEFLQNFSNSLKYNDRSILKNKEIDIYDFNNKIAIEYDGLYYHSSGYPFISHLRNIDKDYHLNKTEECENNNIKLFHIFENEWTNKKTKIIWQSMLSNSLGKSSRIFARKTEVKEVGAKSAKIFLENNHLQGHCNSSIKIGLYFNSELVSLMTFGKPRFNKKYQWELIRFTNKINISVIGGASKIMKYFERTYHPENIISYANRRWSTGNLYEKIGFNFLTNTPPNFFYFQANVKELIPRYKMQKHKLKDMFNNYDNKLSAEKNIYNNKFRKIYDCGNKLYVKTF